MRIFTFFLLTTLTFQIHQSLSMNPDDTMRHTLPKVMTCPTVREDEDADSNLQTPVAAFSPARYIQLVAMARRDSGEKSCGVNHPAAFRINDPRTWDFCAMGVCMNEKCSCFENFIGEKCNQFYGRCWLVYCFLSGCKLELPVLKCRCDPDLYGEIVTSGIYFYDHGVEEMYKSPPPYFKTESFEGPSIQNIPNYKIIPINQRSYENSIELRRDDYKFPGRQKRFFEEDNKRSNNGQNFDRKFRYVTTQHQDKNSGMELQDSAPEEEIEEAKRNSGLARPVQQNSEDNQLTMPWKDDTVHYKSNYFRNAERASKVPISHNSYFSDKENYEPTRLSNSRFDRLSTNNEDVVRKTIISASAEFWNQANLPSLRSNYRVKGNLKPTQWMLFERSYARNPEDFNRISNGKTSAENWNQENLPDSHPNHRKKYNFQPTQQMGFERSYARNQEDFNRISDGETSAEKWNQENLPDSYSNRRNKDNSQPSRRMGFGRLYVRNEKDLIRKPIRQTSAEYWNQANLPPSHSNSIPAYPDMAPRRKETANDFYKARPNHQKSPEFSTKKYLWSDTEEEEEEEFKLVSGNENKFSKYRGTLVVVEILIVIFHILE